MFSIDLPNRTAIVTGASSGLGRHFSKVLAKAGAVVHVAGRRYDVLEQLAAEIDADGGRAFPRSLDVVDSASIDAMFDSVGAVDILVNNAGVTSTESVLEQSEAAFDQIISTNFRGAFLMATRCARRMRNAGRGGVIINVASILGLRQGGQVSAYAASKAAVIQMTKQLALELARFDIRVNALAPGYISTELNREFFETDAGKALIRRIPQRRLGTLADLDGPLLLLASDASRFMTGSVLVVDGGHLVSSL